MEKEEWQRRGRGHRERLRHKFLQRGEAGLTDAEILELLLSFGTPRRDCKVPARAALNRFGSLPAVLEAASSSLQEISGIGPKNSLAIHFIQAVAKRYLKQRLVGRQYLHSSREVREYLLYTMRGLEREVFITIFLDASQAIITSEVMAEGTVNVNTIYPREIMKRGLELNATALIIAHNHPSGSLKPSQQDLRLTKMLSLICQSMQVRLLDHIIIGDDAFSFADQGLMREIGQEAGQLLQQTASTG